jgi:hypothetical protein
VQAETYRGLLARMSASTVTCTQASFQALNEAIKQRAENDPPPNEEKGPAVH